jgi:membrane protein
MSDGTEAAPDSATDDSRESLKERFTEYQERLESKYEEYEHRRAESLPIDVAFRVVEADRRYAGGLIASGMAFRVFVVLVPFAFVVVTAFGFVAEAISSESPQAVAHDLGITGLVASAIDASIGSSTWERLVTLVLALYALLWASWTLMRAMQTVFGLAWGRPPTGGIAQAWRPVLWMVGALLVLFLGGVAVSVLLDNVGLLLSLLIRVAMFGAVVALWVGVSWLLPRDPETTPLALVPGAVLVAVGALVLQFLTVYFFSRYVEDKTQTYGAIGAALAILLWAYLLGRLVVTSAFLNAERWRRARERESPAATPSRR